MFWSHKINLEVQKIASSNATQAQPELRLLRHRWYLFGFIKVAETHQFVSVN